MSIPLVVKNKNGKSILTSISNFDYKKISEKYNIIIISKPNTPVVANIKQLNNPNWYVPDTLKPYVVDTEYWKNNYKMKPFIGCGHNFEEINPNGSSNWDKMHWNDAMNEFIHRINSGLIIWK